MSARRSFLVRLTCVTGGLASLVHELQTGRIAGAGLDVFEAEPNVPAGLLGLDNVVLLPHIASGTAQTRRAMADLVHENLRAFYRDGRVQTPASGSLSRSGQCLRLRGEESFGCVLRRGAPLGFVRPQRGGEHVAVGGGEPRFHFLEAVAADLTPSPSGRGIRGHTSSIHGELLSAAARAAIYRPAAWPAPAMIYSLSPPGS
jgi:hypothetical protein